MSKSYFVQRKSLHAFPKFTFNTQRIQVGNGQYVGVLFVIPVILTIQSIDFRYSPWYQKFIKMWT